VGGGAPDGLAGPGRQVREIPRYAPGSGGGALVCPGELPNEAHSSFTERGPRFALAASSSTTGRPSGRARSPGCRPGAASDDATTESSFIS